jgi:predicted nucleic acid-binding protein
VKVLLDTNVVLDLLLDRAPWSSTLGPVVHAATHGRLELWVAGTTLTNVFYVARKIVDHARVRAVVHVEMEHRAMHARLPRPPGVHDLVVPLSVVDDHLHADFPDRGLHRGVLPDDVFTISP